MNLILLLLLIGVITCFLNGPFVVIWIQGFAFGILLMMLLIWLIFFVLMEGNASLILITSEVLIFWLKTWAYDLAGCLRLAAYLLFLKNFKITLTSFWNLAKIDRGILLIFTRTGLMVFFLFFLRMGTTFRVNLDVIFLLSELGWLSAWREFQLA